MSTKGDLTGDGEEFDTDPPFWLPWGHGRCSCHKCGYTWIGVWAIGAPALTCPSCASNDTERTNESMRKL